LTPTLRNIDQALTSARDLVGRPRDLYKKTLLLLEDVAEERISADTVFVESVRVLLQMRDEKLKRMASLLESLKHTEGALPLSSEAIAELIKQHLACKNASRLPVLIVAAAYQAAGERLSESLLPLNSHNAADLQTGSIGDVEICLVGDDAVVTAYEMKMKRVTIDDIDCAVAKIARASKRINNYLFVTTDTIDPNVVEYANKFYEETGGTEIAILDCIGFLRHFLHLFHRIRADYLDAYQTLVLNEPDSAVSQTLKEAFLALRQAAESDESERMFLIVTIMVSYQPPMPSLISHCRKTLHSAWVRGGTTVSIPPNQSEGSRARQRPSRSSAAPGNSRQAENLLQ
jgi:hypothetical protein